MAGKNEDKNQNRMILGTISSVTILVLVLASSGCSNDPIIPIIGNQGVEIYNAEELPIEAGFKEAVGSGLDDPKAVVMGGMLEISANSYAIYTKEFDAVAHNAVEYKCYISMSAEETGTQRQLSTFKCSVPCDETYGRELSLTFTEEVGHSSSYLFLEFEGVDGKLYRIESSEFYNIQITMDQTTGNTTVQLNNIEFSMIIDEKPLESATYSFSVENRGILCLDYIEVSWE